MCLAVPAEIIACEGMRAKAALQGNTIEVDLSLVDGAGVGDWILVHAGFAIERLDPAEAAETLKAFEALEAARDEEC